MSLFVYVRSLRVRLVAELGGTDRNKNSVSHVWHHLRWNRQELCGTHVEHVCSIKIGGTKWNNPFILNIPLFVLPYMLISSSASTFISLFLCDQIHLQRPASTSDDLVQPLAAYFHLHLSLSL